MNAYIINEETMEWPIYEGDYRTKFSNVSFGNPLIPNPPYAWVKDSQIPTYDPITQAVKETKPIQIDGVWTRQWEVYTLTQEEIDNNHRNLKDQNKSQASNLLSATDWVELGDVANPDNPPYLTNKADFTAYRQQLRAIAINPPITVETWPTKPEEVWSN